MTGFYPPIFEGSRFSQSLLRIRENLPLTPPKQGTGKTVLVISFLEIALLEDLIEGQF
jgi:hypothetical protein